MKTSQKILLAFIAIGVLVIIGSVFNLKVIAVTANLLLIPVLILYYRSEARTWFPLMVFALLIFYIRDVFLFFNGENFPHILIIPFLAGLLIIYAFAITAYQKAKVYPVEILSLLIMYGFLGFLFYTLSDLIHQLKTPDEELLQLYIFLPSLLLAVTFTEYLIKSHYASLWLMLASASLLISELSLFFKNYIIDDISVKIFFPLFHVIAYYAFIEHVLHRRKSKRIPYF